MLRSQLAEPTGDDASELFLGKINLHGALQVFELHRMVSSLQESDPFLTASLIFASLREADEN
jgi:hypothetical protein